MQQSDPDMAHSRRGPFQLTTHQLLQTHLAPLQKLPLAQGLMRRASLWQLKKVLPSSHGCGSNLSHQGTAGFSLWFHFPGLHFGYLFLTHCHMAMGFSNPNCTPNEHPNPTTKIGSKMGGEFTYPKMGSHQQSRLPRCGFRGNNCRASKKSEQGALFLVRSKKASCSEVDVSTSQPSPKSGLL